jgi:hypothetical protein
VPRAGPAESRTRTPPDGRAHPAGADAVEVVEQKAKDMLAQVDAHRDLSSSLALDQA